jgi:hypothetical protein
MKRALAERAKGDNLAPDLSIPDTPRLPKTPRVTHSTSNITSSDVITAAADGVVGSSSSSTTIGAGASLALHPSFSSPSPLQSMMPMFISSTALPTTTSTSGGSMTGNDDGGTQDRSYYLQHQNRALVGELLRLKHVVQTLEQERLARRTQCDFARQCVDTIHGMWFALETSLSNTIAAKHPQYNYPHIDPQVVDPSPGKIRAGETIPYVSCSSSGEGTNVETISGLLRALSQLASQSPPPAITVDAAGTDPTIKSEVSAPSSSSSSSMSSSFNLQTTLTGVQTRVNNLLHMILSLLGAVLSSNSVFLNTENNVFAPQSSFLIEYSDYITKVSTLQGQLDAFHVQLEEISSSRDEALLKEKRIRRYLLRIMAGQAKEDVLRVM